MPFFRSSATDPIREALRGASRVIVKSVTLGTCSGYQHGRAAVTTPETETIVAEVTSRWAMRALVDALAIDPNSQSDGSVPPLIGPSFTAVYPRHRVAVATEDGVEDVITIDNHDGLRLERRGITAALAAPDKLRRWIAKHRRG